MIKPRGHGPDKDGMARREGRSEELGEGVFSKSRDATAPQIANDAAEGQEPAVDAETLGPAARRGGLGTRLTQGRGELADSLGSCKVDEDETRSPPRRPRHSRLGHGQCK